MAKVPAVVVSISVETEPTTTRRSEFEVKAEALREAADDLYSDDGPTHPLSTATWLRARADKYASAVNDPR